MQAERSKEKETYFQFSDVNSIQHIVSKMDTLAGLAIKYGVEEVDIRRLNGLVTDHQMFALRSLQIPMPGRHPPSPVAINSRARNGMYDDALDSSFSAKLKSSQFKLTPAMNSLYDYYGLAHPKNNSLVKGTEMAVFYSAETWRTSSGFDPARHRRTRSLAIENLPGKKGRPNEVATDIDGNNELKKTGSVKPVRRRQKADADSFFFTLESENADRAMDRDVNRFASVTAPLKDSVRINILSPVRKSSSTSNLQESDGSNNSSMRPSSMRSPKPDGFSKPVNAWRNKAALD